jgi:hypothetical protein
MDSNMNIDLIQTKCLWYGGIKPGRKEKFYKNITKAGGSYTPIYITQAEFDAIVNSPTEKM